MKSILICLSVYFLLSVFSILSQISLQYDNGLFDSAKVQRRSDFLAALEYRTMDPKAIRRRHTFLESIDVNTMNVNKTAFGNNYTLGSQRSSEFDFPYIINGKGICKEKNHPYLLIMVPSMHTHIDTRNTIRQTWGRAADPGVWPKYGKLNMTVKLVFLFGTSKTALGHSIVSEESRIYGDIVYADFVDSYFNLTYKSIMGLRWVAEFCRDSKYVLKADEDVFVHVKNLLDFLERRDYLPTGSVYGHALLNSDVLRTGRWGVTRTAFPLDVYPTYTCGNTYVISTNIAAHMYYTAGLLPYINIEDVFVTGIVRTFLGAEITDVVGFTHWFERRPVPCEFKNNVRISATKVLDSLQLYIWEGLKRNLTDCYTPIKTIADKARRPEKSNTYQLLRDDHILKNKTSGKFYVL